MRGTRQGSAGADGWAVCRCYMPGASPQTEWSRCLQTCSCSFERTVSDLAWAFQDSDLKEDCGLLNEAGNNLPIEVGHTLDLGSGKAPTQGKIPSELVASFRNRSNLL